MWNARHSRVCAPEGRFLAIELKVADGRLEPAQATEIGRNRTAGGCAIGPLALKDVIVGIWKTQEGVLQGNRKKRTVPQRNNPKRNAGARPGEKNAHS